MAYRLRLDESVADGLRRLARKELKSAADMLRQGRTPDDDAIHEARKSMKKVRAIVHLVDADGGRGLRRTARRLRAINRTLSKARDADAMLEVLATLKKKQPHLFTAPTFARVRRHLLARKRTLMKNAQHDGAWQDIVDDLRRLRRSAGHWTPEHRRFGALGAGLAITYKRGRKAMHRAIERGQANDFHEWRKQVKTLWYELRLIQDCSPGIRHDIAALDRAERWLGEDHNVVILCAELAKEVAPGNAKIDLDRLQLAADRYQLALRAKAIASLRSVYLHDPGAYLRGIKAAWTSARR